ncbi:hypothetical protein D3C87_1796810 [compost metagenome]
MTDQCKLSENWPVINELIFDYREILIRQLNFALDQGELDEETYREYVVRECAAETIDEVYDFFERIFKDLTNYHRERLQARIIKGAKFIDGLAPTDPRREKAIEKYDALCNRLNGS